MATGLLLVLSCVTVHAENLYVTDRILLGVHEEPNKESMLVNSVPSGTTVTVLGKNNDFTRVKLPDGTEGWVDSAFLVTEQPAPAQYDILLGQHQRLQEEMKTLEEKLQKTEREIQVRRDEVSNAKSTIQELKKQQKSVAAAAATPSESNDAELEAANAEIEQLRQQLEELQVATDKPQAAPAVMADEGDKSAVALEQELELLRLRIEMAMQNLKGEEMLTLDEVAKIRPAMPKWFWGALVLFLVLGAAGGIIWMDYRNRKRHGGFRV